MRVGVMGTGGLGGYYGGMLARAGHEICCLARGAHLQAIQQRGLEIHTQDSGDFTVRVMATDDPAVVGPVDLVLFCVKSYDTVVAAEAIRPMVGPETVVLGMQNGIENEALIAQVAGAEHVLGAVVFRLARIDAPGVVSEGGISGKLSFGELGGAITPRAERLLEVFREAGVAVELVPNIVELLWAKFVFIAGPGSICGLTRVSYGQLRSYPETLELCRATMAEIVEVARGHGVELPGDTVERNLRILLEDMAPEGRSSLNLDLARGRPIEIDAFNGAVCRLGEAAGVATPLNFAIYAALKPYERGAPSAP